MFLTVPPNSIGTSISTRGLSVAGYNFTLTCSVRTVEGLDVPSVLWVDSEGQSINSSEDIVLGDLMYSNNGVSRDLYFDPIRTSDEGMYTCLAKLYSPSLDILLNSSVSYNLDVQLSKIIAHHKIIMGMGKE